MFPRLIIFDADGTLRRCTVEGQPCPNAPSQWELIPGVKEGIALLNQNTQFAIVSNQAGVALGYLSKNMAQRLLDDMVEEAFGGIEAVLKVNVFFCPHAPDAECDCRKPKPRLLEKCMNMALVGADETLYVGDMESDRQAAENVKCSFMWAHDFFDILSQDGWLVKE